MQYSVAVLPFFPCLLQKQENIFFPCIKFSRLSSPKIPRHRNHSTYFLYLLSRCRLLSLELSEHQVRLPLQEQNQQLLLLHGLGTNDQKNTHQTSPPGSYYLYLSPRRRLLSSSCPGKQRSIFYGSWQVLEHFPKSLVSCSRNPTVSFLPEKPVAPVPAPAPPTLKVPWTPKHRILNS